jgi:hypothetical protein
MVKMMANNAQDDGLSWHRIMERMGGILSLWEGGRGRRQLVCQLTAPSRNERYVERCSHNVNFVMSRGYPCVAV